jgi:septum formation protein
VNPLDKAGAYGIQESSDLIIESIKGSFENIMGLPTELLSNRLKKHGFNFFTD